MTKEKILTDLDRIKADLEAISDEANIFLTGYAGNAVELARDAVCHAIDLVNQAKDRRVM